MHARACTRARTLAGLKLLERHGFVEAEQLIEDLVPFMDSGPRDPGAGRLTAAAMRKRAAAHQARVVALRVLRHPPLWQLQYAHSERLL